MTYNNTNKPTAKEFVDALPNGNKVSKKGDWYVTNCVHPAHDDNHPSMGIKDGDTQVIVKCFARDCDKKVLLSYFYENVPFYLDRKRDWERDKKKKRGA
jgi:hypothetical protein